MKDAIMNMVGGRVSTIYLIPGMNVVEPRGDPTNDRRREALPSEMLAQTRAGDGVEEALEVEFNKGDPSTVGVAIGRDTV